MSKFVSFHIKMAKKFGEKIQSFSEWFLKENRVK